MEVALDVDLEERQIVGFVAAPVPAHAERTTCLMVQSAVTYDVRADHFACAAPFAAADKFDSSFGAGVVRSGDGSLLVQMFVLGCGMSSQNAFLTTIPGSSKSRARDSLGRDYP